MLGPPKPRRLDEPIGVLLEVLVPTDHFYRHLEAKLDLSFVREWSRALYAERGRPSVDPVVFFKLQLVMFFEGIRSERKLTETASLNLAHRWYLGYTLDEDLPDHSRLCLQIALSGSWTATTEPSDGIRTGVEPVFGPDQPIWWRKDRFCKHSLA